MLSGISFLLRQNLSCCLSKMIGTGEIPQRSVSKEERSQVQLPECKMLFFPLLWETLLVPSTSPCLHSSAVLHGHQSGEKEKASRNI